MNIREARRKAGISQVRLGELIGLDQSGVSRIERGERPVTVDLLRSIARALGMRPADLLDGDDRRAA